MNITKRSRNIELRYRAQRKRDQGRSWRRVDVLAVVVLAAMALIVCNLIWIQGVQGSQIALEAQANRTRSTVILAKRGTILDANGRVIATSVERYNVGVNQKKIQQFRHYDSDGKTVIGTGAAEAAKLIAPIIGVDRLDLGAKMVGKNTFAYIAKSITPEQWKQITALNIPGVEPEQISDRLYPAGNIAGNLVGYMNRDNTGIAGIEQSLNEQLAGKNGKIVREVDTRGVTIPTGRQEIQDPIPGKNLLLTIDSDIQAKLQQVIDEYRPKSGATWGAATIIEVGTGRILALADTNSVDPNNVQATPKADRGAHSVSSPIEPGSVGKIITYAAAIDQKKVTPTSLFYAKSPITMPNGEKFKDAIGHPAAWMTVAGLIATSYNSGLVQVGDLMTDETRFNYMKSFGLGKTTGVILPAESAGILHDYTKWGRRDRYTNMFGQNYAATTIQLGAMAQAIANKGVYIQPHLVEGLQEKDGSLTALKVPETHRVISEEASKELLSAMVESAARRQGTSWGANIDGYRLAGKTGTGQTSLPGSTALTGVNGTFVGIVPAENPRIVMAVAYYLIDPSRYGAGTATPVFRDVAPFVLQKLAVPYSPAEYKNLPWFKEEM